MQDLVSEPEQQVLPAEGPESVVVFVPAAAAAGSYSYSFEDFGV